jgi:5-methylcytosine-specific restriction protein A
VSEQSERWQHLTTMLAIRSGSRCEGCGQPFTPGKVEPSRHHRLPGKMGGREYNPAHDTLPNLLLLCGGRLAGVLGCHGRTESYRTEAYARGFLVREGQDPATVPVTLWSGRIVLLDPYVGYVNPPPGDTPVYALGSA